MKNQETNTVEFEAIEALKLIASLKLIQDMREGKIRDEEGNIFSFDYCNMFEKSILNSTPVECLDTAYMLAEAIADSNPATYNDVFTNIGGFIDKKRAVVNAGAVLAEFGKELTKGAKTAKNQIESFHGYLLELISGINEVPNQEKIRNCVFNYIDSVADFVKFYSEYVIYISYYQSIAIRLQAEGSDYEVVKRILK